MAERRLKWLAAAVVLWGVAIFCKLISLQVLHHKDYARKARAHQELSVEIPAPRGTIFDRSGRALAMSVAAESVLVNPIKLPDLEVAANLLSRVLRLDHDDLLESLKYAVENHRGYLIVKRRIPFEEAETLRNLRLDWVSLERESVRHYPNHELAAHVLGSVDFEEKGNAGIELALDAELRGQPGKIRMLTDVKRRGIDEQLASEARPGNSLTLSIDERMQYVAERELAAAVESHGAASGSVVAMDPHTGDVLALASYPTYDPNLPPQPNEAKTARINHALSLPFEPGSVYKVITLSAALETTDLNPESPINCHGGVLSLPGRVVHDSHAGMGVVPMKTVLAKSSNIGAIEVGMRVGQENMYTYMTRFGFGGRTGIPLPAESPGKVWKLKRWGKTSLASVSMGQEVSVTTLQLARAVSAVANGGLLFKPRLVIGKNGRPVPPEPPVRILRPETSLSMRQMMEEVVLHGSGTRAKLQGYTVGGKTGSAQIFDLATKHYTHNYNGSFAGFAPLNNPAIVVVVTLNGTHGGDAGFGGVVAAPVFRVVTAESLRVMDVPKDLPDEPVPNTLVAKAATFADASDPDTSGSEPNILEEGDGEEAAAEPAGERVPNFRGMTMRAVLAEAAARGLTILPDGSGVARVQSPPPGAPVRQGERIRVQFSR